MKKTSLTFCLLSAFLTSSASIKAIDWHRVSPNTATGIISGGTGLFLAYAAQNRNSKNQALTKTHWALIIAQLATISCSLYNGLAPQNLPLVKAINSLCRWTPSVATGVTGACFSWLAFDSADTDKTAFGTIAVAQLTALGCSLYNALSAKNATEKDPEKV